MLELGRPDFTSCVSIDIETTGLGPDARIVELGAARVAAGRVTDTYTQLVNPMIRMDPSASAVNGISDRMLIGKPLIGSAIRGFTAFIGDRYILKFR